MKKPNGNHKKIMEISLNFVLFLEAILDARWNSLVISGKRFLEILPSIIKALKHKEIKSKILGADDDINTITRITEILEPARVATANLSSSIIHIIYLKTQHVILISN